MYINIRDLLYLVRSFSKLLSCSSIPQPYLLALEVSKFAKEMFISRNGQITVSLQQKKVKPVLDEPHIGRCVKGNNMRDFKLNKFDTA